MPPPHLHTQKLNYMAIWHHLHLQQTLQGRIYIRAPRQAFTQPPRWEPWNDNQIPPVLFLELFRMSINDFTWLGHGATYVTIAHVFSIGKETADKASGRFVIAVLKTFRKRAIDPSGALPALGERYQPVEQVASLDRSLGSLAEQACSTSVPECSTGTLVKHSCSAGGPGDRLSKATRSTGWYRSTRAGQAPLGLPCPSGSCW
ncbi:hypothetical protein PCASD_17124 [Puccinia coronata f. sp. avenae]|uniref:Uncharacterized protein n=1 Tax=Puccinia coronata f. sp. avenae TaxID=200324 RepID=A0A2N5SXE8_9BASI|nr:hypothetical protein PCASD_17124 [Puccinia coronata f. sp. avenae]